MIRFSKDAVNDLNDIFYYIAIECNMPFTAEKFLRGLIGCAMKIAAAAPIYQPAASRYEIVRRYGMYTAKYKKYTIIYNIVRGVAVIERIMPSQPVCSTWRGLSRCNLGTRPVCSPCGDLI